MDDARVIEHYSSVYFLRRDKMEKTEIILIALTLLLVFVGFQIQKVVALFRTSSGVNALPIPVKTVMSASVLEKKPVKKTTVHKSTGKKSTAKTALKKSVKKQPKKSSAKTAPKKA